MKIEERRKLIAPVIQGHTLHYDYYDNDSCVSVPKSQFAGQARKQRKYLLNLVQSVFDYHVKIIAIQYDCQTIKHRPFRDP